jgi:hypothetical protein
VKLNAAGALGLPRAPLKNQDDNGLRYAPMHKLCQPLYGLFNVLAQLRVPRPVLRVGTKSSMCRFERMCSTCGACAVASVQSAESVANQIRVRGQET